MEKTALLVVVIIDAVSVPASSSLSACSTGHESNRNLQYTQQCSLQYIHHYPLTFYASQRYRAITNGGGGGRGRMIISQGRARNNGRSTINDRQEIVFDRRKSKVAVHLDRQEIYLTIV